MEYPQIQTERLLLRKFALSDAPRVKLLAGDRAIAATTALIPHPYPDGAAEEWIESHQPAFDAGTQINFAIVRREDDLLVGAISLEIRPQHKRAEVGYWMGRGYWGSGYTTEALRAVIEYAFSIGLHRVFAEHFSTNPASGRVMQKAGMRHEGTLRHHMMKWNQYVNCEVYGILAEDH